MSRIFASVLAILVLAVVGFNSTSAKAAPIDVDGSSMPSPIPACEQKSFAPSPAPGGIAFEVLDNAVVPCRLKVAVYDTYGEMDFNKRSYDLFGYKEVVIRQIPELNRRDLVSVTINEAYDTNCPAAAYALFGWEERPKARLTIFDSGYAGQPQPIKLGVLGYKCRTLLGTIKPADPDPVPFCTMEGINTGDLGGVFNNQNQGPCRMTVAIYYSQVARGAGKPIWNLYDYAEVIIRPYGNPRQTPAPLLRGWENNCYAEQYFLFNWDGKPIQRLDEAHKYPVENVLSNRPPYSLGSEACDANTGLPLAKTNSTVGDGPIVTGPTIACATMDIVNVFNNVDHCGKTGPNDGGPFSTTKPVITNNNTTTVTIGPAPYPRPPATGNTALVRNPTSLSWWMAMVIPLLAVSPVLACTAKRK